MGGLISLELATKFGVFGEPSGIRTQDHLIKSQIAMVIHRDNVAKIRLYSVLSFLFFVPVKILAWSTWLEDSLEVFVAVSVTYKLRRVNAR